MQPIHKKSVGESTKKHMEAAYEMMSQWLGKTLTPEPDAETEPEKQDDLDKDDIDRKMRIREKLRKQIIEGVMDDSVIEIEVEESGVPLFKLFTSQAERYARRYVKLVWSEKDKKTQSND